MAQVVVTIKIMPESPDVNLEDLKGKVEEKIKGFAGEGEMKFEEDPIGFGLSALKVLFAMDEEKGDTEKLEEDIKTIEGIVSAEVIDMRRALG
tara:strand:- start:570 stop:848 length:279 start_codon:yes stop_codon:yes gene_type:complete